MSANIYWEPSARARTSLYTMAPQAFLESLEAANIRVGYALNEENLDALLGMANVYGELNEKNPYYQLAVAIKDYALIELTVEY